MGEVWKAHNANLDRRAHCRAFDTRGVRVLTGWGIAALCASLGDADDAFAWLEIAMQAMFAPSRWRTQFYGRKRLRGVRWNARVCPTRSRGHHIDMTAHQGTFFDHQWLHLGVVLLLSGSGPLLGQSHV